MAIISQFNPSQPPALSVSETGASTANEVYSLTAPSLATEALTMTAPDGTTFSWKPTELVYRDASGQMDYIVGSSPSTLATRGKEARYQRTFPSADDVFIAENQQVKHWTVLHEPPRQPADYLTSGIEFGVSGIVNGVALPSGTHESIQSEPFNLPQPYVKDMAGNEVYGRYEVVDTDEGQQLFVWFDASFLETALYPVMVDPTIVVSAGYSTEGNGGRKLVELSNGWLVALAKESTRTYLYKSQDKGTTWSQLCFYGMPSNTDGSMVAIGTNVHVLFSAGSGNTTVYYHRFDATTVTNTQQSLTITVDSGQSDLGKCSLAINSAGTELWATWASKNSTYPNSFNIRTAKGTISGGTVTWASPEQRTTINTTGQGYDQPCIVIKSDGLPAVVSRQLGSSSSYLIRCHFLQSGGAWGAATVYNGSSYTQSNPCAVVDSNGVIHVVWHGTDANYSVYNIRYSQSTDGGSTWSSMYNVTNLADAQNDPTITVDKDNKFYVYWSGGAGTSYKQIRTRTRTNGTWSAISTLTSKSWQQRHPSSMSSNATIGWIWQDDQGYVQFDKITLNAPPTAPTGLTRSNFDATQSAIFSWQHNDPDAGDSQSAYELEYQENVSGSTVTTTGKVASTTASHTFAANTFVNGKEYKWRVRTYDSQSEVSPWSDYAIFKASAVPNATVTDPVSNATINGSSYTFRGSYSQAQNVTQKSFRFILWDSAGTALVQDSGTILGTTNAKTFENLANNTSYQIQLEVTSQDDIKGQSAKVTFSTSFVTPQAPSVSLSQNSLNATVTVSVTNPTPSAGEPTVTTNEIYRRKSGATTWTKIGEAVTSFTDHQCPEGAHEYSAIAVGNNGTKSARSSAQSINVTYLGWWVVDTETNEKFQFVYNVPVSQISLEEERQELRTFSSKPFVRYGQYKAERGTLAGLKTVEGATPAREQARILQSLIDRRKPFLLKSDRGDVWTVNLHNLRRSFSRAMSEEVSVEWVEV